MKYYGRSLRSLASLVHYRVLLRKTRRVAMSTLRYRSPSSLTSVRSGRQGVPSATASHFTCKYVILLILHVIPSLPKQTFTCNSITFCILHVNPRNLTSSQRLPRGNLLGLVIQPSFSYIVNS